MSIFPAKIQRLIDEGGYEFRFGDYISKGFALVQRNFGLFIAFYLLYMVIQFAGAMIPIIGTIALWVIGPAISIGPYHVAYKLDRGESIQLSDFFRGFDNFGQLFLVSFLTALIVIGAALPGIVMLITSGVGMAIFGGEGLGALATGGTMIMLSILLILIPVVYLGVSYMWAPMFVWFYKMDAWPAMEASRRLIGRNWFVVFGFAFVLGLIAISGALLLLVGLLFTLPAVACALYASFADVTGLLDEAQPETDVIDHFIPFTPQ